MLHQQQGRNYFNEDKMVRIGLELVDITRDLVGTSLQSNAAATFQEYQPRIVDFLERTVKQFRPRYVHDGYRTLASAPYVVDPEGETFRGSFGTVQKVIHRQTGISFAMRTFHNVFSAKDRAKILREIAVLEVCFHKNIVQLREAFSLENDLRLIMFPWAPCTLSLFLRMPDFQREIRCPWFAQGSADSDRCIYRILFELADGVSYLHGRSIKHKDTKPDNILLHQENSSQCITPLITDVGISKVYIPGAGTNPRDSTYVYLAPEQHDMVASTLESDIWQLGCCFAEILSVAVGGTRAHEKLEDSFLRED
ncbi:kinase-like domain-containing protein, partial [Apodospora peruviana]